MIDIYLYVFFVWNIMILNLISLDNWHIYCLFINFFLFLLFCFPLILFNNNSIKKKTNSGRTKIKTFQFDNEIWISFKQNWIFPPPHTPITELNPVYKFPKRQRKKIINNYFIPNGCDVIHLFISNNVPFVYVFPNFILIKFCPSLPKSNLV